MSPVMEVDMIIVWLVETPEVYPLIISVIVILDISILFNPKHAISIIPHATFHVCNVLAQPTANVLLANKI